MSATVASDASTTPIATSVPMVGLLRALLWAEALAGLAVAIFLSMAASVVAGNGDASTEEGLRFAAGGAFIFGILALVASRGARKRKPWSWTMSAILQVTLAIATGVAVLAVEWHPLYLAGFGLAAVIMLVLSTASVRRTLGQA